MIGVSSWNCLRAGALSQALVESGALIHAMAPQTVTLEDLFFSFTEGDGIPPTPATSPVPASAGPEPAQASETAR